MMKTIYENKNIKFTGSLDFKDRIIYDNTDHFCFACDNCKQHLDIFKISIYDNDTLCIFTKCPVCGCQNQRKIYLDSKVNKQVFKAHFTKN